MVCEMNLLALLTVVLDLDVYDDTRRVCRQSAFRTPHNHRLTGLHSNVSAASWPDGAVLHERMEVT